MYRLPYRISTFVLIFSYFFSFANMKLILEQYQVSYALVMNAAACMRCDVQEEKDDGNEIVDIIRFHFMLYTSL